MAHDRITYGVNTWDFVAILGLPQIPQRMLKPVEMPGVDGLAFKYMANRAQPSRLTLVAVATDQSDEEAWIASMAALTALRVAIYTGTGVLYQNQVFMEVVHRESRQISVGAWANVSLGNTGRLLIFEVTIQFPYGV